MKPMEDNKRPPIHKAARFVLVGFFMLVTITQFNNCGGYSTPNSTMDGSSSVSCTTVTCVVPSSNNLNVTPHLYNGEEGVPANVSEFNLGGDCNEGGYVNNIIRWELFDNTNRSVRNSSMQIAAGVTADSRCVNGRFLIYVPLTPLTVNNADPVDRTGLYINTTTRAAYSLHITIMVTDPTTGAPQQYQASVPLTAI
jgi:hypothetical protein